MKLNNYIIQLLILVAFPILGQPPEYGHNVDDDDYYMFPIRPNQPNTLAGNMGELRSSHFHAGLDIRTGGRSGLPVFAAADGYISRISISPVGYGKALYITHLNGETTVYAHLDRFIDTLTYYTRQEQYKQKSLHVKLFPNKDELQVKKGSIIAYSGNSGSSGGPHLHFEIRDKNHLILNPLNYNFEEIIDTTSPIIQSIAILPFSTSSRVNGIFDRIELETTKASNLRYHLKDTVYVYGEIGFELLTYDKLNGANYKCGVSEIDFYIDDELLFHQKIDSLNFAQQRNVLTHYNYPAYITSGDKYHKMYVDDGNELDVYETNTLKGKKVFKSKNIHFALIKVTDVLGNEAFLEFVVKSTPPTFLIPQQKNTILISQTNNILVINNNGSDSTIQVTSPHGSHSLTPVYASNNRFTFLWDLDDSPVYSVDLCDSLVILDKVDEVPSNTSFDHYSDNIQTHFRNNSLFDTLMYSSNYRYDSTIKTEFFSLGNPNLYPLKNSIDITVSPTLKYDANRTHMYRFNNNGYSFVGGEFNDNQFEFSTRDFGEYVLLTDSIAPTITPISILNNNLKFKITDDLSGIRNFNVFVNNNWILMDYDYKTKYIWSVDLSLSPNESTEIKVIVTDMANNETIYTSKLK